jgi:hypothetical protein
LEIDMRQIKFTASGSSAKYGAFKAGDILKCSPEEAKHFVEEANAAEYTDGTAKTAKAAAPVTETAFVGTPQADADAAPAVATGKDAKGAPPVGGTAELSAPATHAKAPAHAPAPAAHAGAARKDGTHPPKEMGGHKAKG